MEVNLVFRRRQQSYIVEMSIIQVIQHSWRLFFTLQVQLDVTEFCYCFAKIVRQKNYSSQLYRQIRGICSKRDNERLELFAWRVRVVMSSFDFVR